MERMEDQGEIGKRMGLTPGPGAFLERKDSLEHGALMELSQQKKRERNTKKELFQAEN